MSRPAASSGSTPSRSTAQGASTSARSRSSRGSRRSSNSIPASSFVRGLIHSDGCRTINRFRTTLPSGRVAEYAYARYFFSNLSADIRGLFCSTCDALGVRWTLSNPRNVSVSHRKSVAVLDAIGCAKD